MLQKRDIKAHDAQSEVNELEARKAAIIAELGSLEIDIADMHAKEQEALLQDNATEEVAGACTDADVAAANKKGSGHGAGAFPTINADCGKASYSVWWGFNQGDFAKCVMKDVPGLGQPCANCIAKQSQFGVDNCKWCASRVGADTVALNAPVRTRQIKTNARAARSNSRRPTRADSSVRIVR